jgi:hypothetical protein
MTPYSIVNIKKFASKSNQDLEFDGDGQDVQDDEEKEEEDDITRDAMIKVRYCIIKFLVFLDMSLLLISCLYLFIHLFMISLIQTA